MIHAYGILYLVESSLKLRSDVKLTLRCYTHSVSEDRMAAAGAVLAAIFSHSQTEAIESGLSERQFGFKSLAIIVARNRTGSHRKIADWEILPERR